MNKNFETQLRLAKKVISNNAEADYIGEEVTQLIHGIEGGYFAEKAKHHSDVIVASLFHDIGHYAENIKRPQMKDLGILHHEWVGARIMRELGFNLRVCNLIKNHVDAKRYLAKKKSSYYNKLSAASKATLNFQGGLMTDDELLEFEQSKLFKEIIQVRANDEKAKEVDLELPGIAYFDKYLLAALDTKLFKNYNHNKEIIVLDVLSIESLLKEISTIEIDLEQSILLVEDSYLNSFQKFDNKYNTILQSLYIEPLLNNLDSNSAKFILENISNSIINKYVLVTSKNNKIKLSQIAKEFSNIKIY